MHLHPHDRSESESIGGSVRDRWQVISFGGHRRRAPYGVVLESWRQHMRIQIGNLDESVEDRTLARLFARHGAVLDARVATHWETGRSTGVGFVEMESDDAGERAIAALNGQLHHGR